MHGQIGRFSALSAALNISINLFLKALALDASSGLSILTTSKSNCAHACPVLLVALSGVIFVTTPYNGIRRPINLVMYLILLLLLQKKLVNYYIWSYNEQCSLIEEPKNTMPKTLNNVKEDILLVTRELLKDTGYSDLNIRKIAARCGVATGTVYNYYTSKNEIIVEILLNEWNLMLRRIDQNVKAFPNLIDKLEIMFNELNYFMTNVHGSWFETYPISNDSNMDILKIKEQKKLLRNQLSDKICVFITTDKIENQEALSICDIIASILITYSNENIEFSRLKLSLIALVNELERLT